MRRRRFLMLMAAVLAARSPSAATSQATVGFLRPLPPTAYPETLKAFITGLAKTGFREGQNVGIEHRWSQGGYDELARLARELVAKPVDVIFTGGGAVTALAAMRATSRLPIVFVAGDDPVRAGIVKTLGRPDRNVTGVTLYAFDTEVKKLQIMADALPRIPAIGILRNPDAPEADLQATALKSAGNKLGRKIHIFDAKNPQAIETAFTAMGRMQVHAVLVVNDVYFSVQSKQMIELAHRHAIATMFDFRHHVMAGGLMSYGSSLSQAYEQAGIYCGRVLRGEKLSELPVIQPTHFELVVNLRTAQTLNIALPRSVMSMASEIVQ